VPARELTLRNRWQWMNQRVIYLLCSIATMLLGLASRRYRAQLPSFVGEYSGDTLWALMSFLVVSLMLAGRPLVRRAGISMSLCIAVEFSQLYHAPWIDSIRDTTLGGLILGFGFLWTDLVCYSVGIATGVLAELGLARVARLH